MTIPFVDFARSDRPIQLQIDYALEQALESRRFLKGAEVTSFERAFASALGVQACVATANGTDSLFLALKACGIGHGDEVITPAFSWISSSETITACGARPVFADVEPDSYTLSPTDVLTKIGAHTKAVIVVHLYGQAARISAIRQICQSRGLLLIEDCAQAHLTRVNGKPTGSFGDVACFSFYPTKNLGAIGDAGGIVTDDPELARKVRRLANHGALDKDDHELEGYNSRMDTVQAAVLLAKLPYLNKMNLQRRANAQAYLRNLLAIPQISLPVEIPDTEHTFHLFVVRAGRRDHLRDFLTRSGIETMIHYPKALPNLPAYAYLGHQPQDFPVASRLQDEVLSLPIFPGLTPDEISYTCGKIKEFYSSP